jgi:hypothetical protein
MNAIMNIGIDESFVLGGVAGIPQFPKSETLVKYRKNLLLHF